MAEPLLNDLPLRDRYATNRDDLVRHFYAPCLGGAISYDRAVGYFRSSILLLAGGAVADFAAKGRRIRLICSPELTEEDIEALEKGYDRREKVGEALCRVIEDAVADPLGGPVVEFLATLVAVGCLDVRIAFRTDGHGIFHDKIGVFRDAAGNAVSFTGSANETLSAWDPSGNHESFDVFRSWTSEGGRVQRHVEDFERLWNGLEPGVETLRFPEVAHERLVSVSNPEGVGPAYEKIRRSRTQDGRKSPRPHQLEAIEVWKLRGRRGILEHATGSGKTITAITAMREWLEAGRPVLILVPSELLLTQWRDEVRAELGEETRMLLVGADNSRWRRTDVLEWYTGPEGGPCVTLAMLQTASTEEFLRHVRGGEHLMLIADEVHRAGSPRFSRVLSIDAGARMGLSATPKRFGDPEGTERLLGYFGGVVHSFFLADAIAAGRLCSYTYYVHPVELSPDETLEWRRMTAEIGKEIARASSSENGELSVSERAKLLLIRRARILKQASGKVPLATEVVCEHYEPGQRWLVYCDVETQLEEVVHALREKGLPCTGYSSQMQGSREAALAHFESVGGVLVAIKMLDEGVDMPATDRALILASSRNPREFIQRRGRVLRISPGKSMAEIHDALVMPPRQDEETDTIAILKGELARAVRFAEHAVNDATKYQLRKMAMDRDVDPDELGIRDGFEEDEERT